MENRIKQLPLKVQKFVYEMAGLAGTSCDVNGSKLSTSEWNQAMTVFIFASPEELKDFLSDDYGEHLNNKYGTDISWNRLINHRMLRKKDEYHRYLRSPEWKQKRDFVMARAMRFLPPEPPIIIKRSLDRYGRLIEFIEVEWKSICEREGCSNEAKDVHHHNYDRVGKERIGIEPTASEENDLIALCCECHNAWHKSIN